MAPDTEALTQVEVVPYDQSWPLAYVRERADVLELGGAAILDLEHIGSTAAPGLWAKPIIDMMAAVADLNKEPALAARLAAGDLKLQLAEQHSEDSLAYTRAKTAFIQDLIDKARAELGLPSIDVWAD